MELSPKQQINELIKNNHSVLIISHSALNGDALGSMLALEKVLTKMGKEVNCISSEKPQEKYGFLPNLTKINNSIAGTRDFIIKFDTQKTPLEKLSYNHEDNFVNVVITPKAGKINQSDIEFVQGNFKYDLIFVLDTPSVNKIDAVYDQETELFFETPIINIDHHEGNEYFGTVNFVDLTATSTCEILVSIIESFGAGNFDQEVATCLLTGIIADTRSYKDINTTPKSLTISAQMLAAGAKQQEIINHLYKSRSINAIKAWGGILSKIEYNKDFNLALVAISLADTPLQNITSDDLRIIFEDYFINIPNVETSLLLLEKEENHVWGIIQTTSGLDLKKIIPSPNQKMNGQQIEFEANNTTLKNILNQIILNLAELQGKEISQIAGNQAPPVKEQPSPISIIKHETVLADFTNDPISKAIESIDQEIDDNLPAIDIEDAKAKEDTLRPVGNILENHKPGTALNENGVPYSPAEIGGSGNRNTPIRTWQNNK